MPWGVAASVGASLAGSAISSAMSPSTSGSGTGGPNLYVPTGLGAADTGWQGLLTSQLNNYNAGNPYAGGYQAAANATSPYYGYLSAAALQNAGDLGAAGQRSFGVAQNLQDYGQQVYQTALDPRSALYNRTVQQLQDQTGATNSMYGLGSSAAGAGVANQALSNFNIDWQNQQLSRQLQGLQGLTSAYNQAGQYEQLGGQQLAGNLTLGAQAPGYALAQGQVPYSTAQGITNSNLAQAQGIQGQIIPYLNYGQGATSNAFAAQSQGAGALGAGVSQGIQGLGSSPQVQNAFSNYFNPAGGSFSGGDFSGAFTSSPYYSGGGNSYGFTM